MQEIISKLPIFIGNHILLVFAWVAVLGMLIYSIIKLLLNKVKNISNQEATLLINREDAVIVDIRKTDIFNSGHLVNSYNVSAVDIKNKNINKLEKYKEQPIIVVCERGLEADAPANELYKQGFKKVYKLKEGIVGWLGESLPVVKK